MKNIVNIIICVAIILSILFVCGYAETHYIRQGIVVEIYEDNDTTVTVIKDKVNHYWEYETNKFYIGEEVSMKMHNNYTDNFTDDIILNIKSR